MKIGNSVGDVETDLNGMSLGSYQVSLLLSLHRWASDAAVSCSCRCILGSFLLTIANA